MTLKTLKHTLSKFQNLAILVIGDYFLDRYLTIDPDLAETSIETGLETHAKLSPFATGPAQPAPSPPTSAPSALDTSMPWA